MTEYMYSLLGDGELEFPIGLGLVNSLIVSYQIRTLCIVS